MRPRCCGQMLCAWAILAGAVGCGPANPLGRIAISGKVTLDGQPLDKGAIELHPIEGGVQSGDLISGGSYSMSVQQGPTAGKYRVVIYDTYETPPLPPGHMPGDDIPPAPKPKSGDRRDLTKTQARLDKQVARAEEEIAELESRIKARDQELADPVLYQDFARWHDLHLEQERWKKDLERLTARWSDLSQELEEVKEKLAACG